MGFLTGAGVALAYVVLGLVAYRLWYLQGPSAEYGWWGTWGYLAEVGILLTWPVSIPVSMARHVLWACQEARREPQPRTPPRLNPDFFAGDRETADE